MTEEAAGPGIGADLDALLALELDTPHLVVDLSTLRANIERMAGRARSAGKVLRPHVKTHKMPQVAHLQLAAGSPGIQVAKLGEAEVMAEAGVEDILVAYPIVGRPKLLRLAELAGRVRLSVSLDSHEVARGVAEAARLAGRTVGVLVEIDTGLHRIGVSPGPEAAELALRVAELAGLEMWGVLTHEGHVYTAAGNEAEMERMTREACARVVETADLIRARGLAVPVTSVGSSGTARFGLEAPGITEVRPGTYVFNDRTQIQLGAATERDVAACVISTVVSRPAPDRAVIDAGSKALSSDQTIVKNAGRSFGAILGHSDWDIVRVSEEHGVLAVPADARLRVGDRVAVLPNHICAVVNLHDGVTVIDGGRVVDRWSVAARGRLR